MSAVQNWKSTLATVLLAAVVLQGTIVYAANNEAAGMPGKYTVNREDGIRTFIIPVSTEASERDFVREYPQAFYLSVSAGDAIASGAAGSDSSDASKDAVEEASGGRYASLNLSVSERQLLARVVALLRKEQGDEQAETQSGDQQTEAQQRLNDQLQRRIEELLNQLPEQPKQQSSNRLKGLVYGKGGLYTADQLNAAIVTEAEYEVVTKAVYGPYLLEE